MGGFIATYGKFNETSERGETERERSNLSICSGKRRKKRGMGNSADMPPAPVGPLSEPKLVQVKSINVCDGSVTSFTRDGRLANGGWLGLQRCHETSKIAHCLFVVQYMCACVSHPQGVNIRLLISDKAATPMSRTYHAHVHTCTPSDTISILDPTNA